MIGRIYGPYRITGHLGRYGEFDFWAGEHCHLGHSVAIELLPPDIALDGPEVSCLRRHMDTLATIEHSGIVQIAFIGPTETGGVFIAFEQVAGESLDRYIRRKGPMSIAAASDVVRHLVEAMAAVHDVHLLDDVIEPAHVLIVPDILNPGGLRVKLLGVGTSHLRKGKGADVAAMCCTGDHRPPESSIEATSPNVQTLLNRVGGLLFLCLSGRTPPMIDHGEDEHPMDGQLVSEQLKRVGSELPAEIIELVRHLTTELPSERIPTLTALLDELRRLENTPCMIASRSKRPQFGSASATTFVGPAPGVYQRRPHDACTLVGAASSLVNAGSALNRAGPLEATKRIPLDSLRAAHAAPDVPHRVALPGIPAVPAQPVSIPRPAPVTQTAPVSIPTPTPVEAAHPASYHGMTSATVNRRTGVVIAICSVVGIAGATLAAEIASDDHSTVAPIVTIDATSMSMDGGVPQMDAISDIDSVAAATAAYEAGDYRLAYQLCSKLVERDSKHALAHLWCAQSACQLRERDTAVHHYRNVIPQSRDRVTKVCASVDIEVTRHEL